MLESHTISDDTDAIAGSRAALATYDLFISYSRRDQIFAAALQRALERYRPPKGIEAPNRHLKVFRDEQDMTGNDYRPTITKYLTHTSKLIVICTPAARASFYVNEEVRIFAAVRGGANIIPILLAGIPNNEASAERSNEMAFPEALCAVLQMPFAKDFRRFDSAGHERVDGEKHSSAWYWLLADIYNVGREDIEQRDRARRQRQRRRWTAAVSTLAALAAAALLTMEKLREDKAVQQGVAVSRKLAAQVPGLLDSHLDRAALIALHAYRHSPTADAKGAMLAALTANPRLLKFLHGHTASVPALAFSRDGKLLASGSLDSHVIIWKTDTWQQDGTALENHGRVRNVGFNPYNDILVSSGFDAEINLWDVHSHAPFGQPLNAHAYGVAFSPDPTCPVFVSASSNGEIAFWDVALWQQSGAPLKTGVPIYDLALSPDCQTLAAGGSDGSLRFWSVPTRELLRRQDEAHHAAVQVLAFNTSGDMLASGGLDGAVWVWNVRALRGLTQADPIDAARYLVGRDDPDGADHSGVISARFSADDNLLAVGRERGASTELKGYYKRSLGNQQPVNGQFRGFDDSVTSLAASPSQPVLVSGHRDGALLVWDTSASLSQIRPLGAALQVPGGGEATSLALSPDGTLLLSGGQHDSISVWNVTTHSLKTVLRPGSDPRPMEALAFSPDGLMFASEGSDGELTVWAAKTLQSVKTLGPQDSSALGTSIVFSPDAKVLARLNVAGQIDLWETTSWKHIGRLDASDTGMNLADAEMTRIPGFELDPHGKRNLSTTFTRNLLFSRDGRTLISTIGARRIVFWDLERRIRMREIVAPISVEHLALSRDGRLLAAALWNHDVMFWSVTTGRSSGEIISQADARRIAFGQKDQILAVGGHDGTLSLWDVETRRRLGEPLNQRFSTGDRWATGLAFSQDGNAAASSDYDGEVVVWDMSIESWIRGLCYRASRNLSCDEWRSFEGASPYQRACPDLPSPDRCKPL
jgi:WD40 repeat protein